LGGGKRKGVGPTGIVKPTLPGQKTALLLAKEEGERSHSEPTAGEETKASKHPLKKKRKKKRLGTKIRGEGGNPQ